MGRRANVKGHSWRENRKYSGPIVTVESLLPFSTNFTKAQYTHNHCAQSLIKSDPGAMMTKALFGYGEIFALFGLY